MPSIDLQPVTWERMIRAVEKVRERLMRTTKALEEAGLPYAVVGDHAVAYWVGTVDESAVRNSVDVELLIHRSDLAVVHDALERVGFKHKRHDFIVMYTDGPKGKPRDAVKLHFTGEPFSRGSFTETSQLHNDDVLRFESYNIIALRPLVEMLLNAHRSKEYAFLYDLIDVGLVDSKWLKEMPNILRGRLQDLLDNPE